MQHNNKVKLKDKILVNVKTCPTIIRTEETTWFRAMALKVFSHRCICVNVRNKSRTFLLFQIIILNISAN